MAVTIKPRRARFIEGVDDKCHKLCALDILETFAHRFWYCRIIARKTWDTSIGVVSSTKARANHKGPWRALDWLHDILRKKCQPLLVSMPNWLVLKGITLWTL